MIDLISLMLVITGTILLIVTTAVLVIMIMKRR